MHTLYTVGYEGHTIDTFVDLLLAHNIAQVLDVRQRPHSRKPGFSKTRLREALHAVSIDYLHLGDLGTPKPLRDMVRATHDYAEFFRAYEQHLQEQQEALAEALRYVQQQRSVLLCLEADPAHCHRSSVAAALEAMAGNSLHVEHVRA
jgi:uncharacterized protein (DUF488 family)